MWDGNTKNNAAFLALYLEESISKLLNILIIIKYFDLSEAASVNLWLERVRSAAIVRIIAPSKK